jgi:hypothetical protein
MKIRSLTAASGLAHLSLLIGPAALAHTEAEIDASADSARLDIAASR